MIISGTGPRNLIIKPERWREVSDRLENLLIDLKPELVVSGGAEGFDELLAWAAWSKGIPYILYIPYPGFAETYWKRRSVTGFDRSEDFKEMLNLAQGVRYLYTGPKQGGVYTTHLRNNDLIDASDLMIVCDSDTPGTTNTFNKIKEQGGSYVVV